MNNRGLMAKKKKTPVAQIEPISLPDEDLAKARAWLEGLNADIAYSQAKRQLAEACGWERSKSNAVIVALHEEGFMAGEKNYFCNPNAPAEPGVVRGAREVSNFTIMLQSDPEVSVPLPYAIHCLPGDVFMLRKTVTGNWRVSNFVRVSHRSFRSTASPRSRCRWTLQMFPPRSISRRRPSRSSSCPNR